MPGTVSDERFEKVDDRGSRGSRWSQHCKLLPGSGHGRESFRSAWFPIRSGPIRFGRDQLQPERVVVVRRQPRPRVTRSKRAMYMRRRVIAASLGLGLVLTAAHAGIALGGSTTTSGRSPHPHVEHIVVQPGDTLWSIARRVRSALGSTRRGRPTCCGAGYVRPAGRRNDLGSGFVMLRGSLVGTQAGQLRRGQLGRRRFGSVVFWSSTTSRSKSARSSNPLYTDAKRRYATWSSPRSALEHGDADAITADFAAFGAQLFLDLAREALDGVLVEPSGRGVLEAVAELLAVERLARAVAFAHDHDPARRSARRS